VKKNTSDQHCEQWSIWH